MLIANPISDSVFKWLLENPRIARFFIETILGETVTEVEMKPLEKKYVDEEKLNELSVAAALATVMLDFVATIKTENGTYKKVLIEIQNARNATDIMRFRNYLAQHYSRKDEVMVDGVRMSFVLPIITIYFFGFKLKSITQPVVKVTRSYVDRATNEVVNTIDEFIEQLTHDCHIVQIPRISSKIQSKLDSLLSFFEQSNFVDDTKMYKEYLYPIDDENIKLIADELHFAGTDPEKRQSLALEREGYRILDVNLEAKDKVIAENLKTIAENLKEIQENLETIRAEKKAREEEKKAKEEALKIVEARDKEIEELRRMLND